MGLVSRLSKWPLNLKLFHPIANGAKFIWDFDDDNILKFWLKNASPDSALEIDNYIENISGKYN